MIKGSVKFIFRSVDMLASLSNRLAAVTRVSITGIELQFTEAS